jgi:hypothetical protein
MSSPIVQPSAFNASKVVITPPKPNKAGGKMAFVGYGESRNLVLQTPSLRTPFGVRNSTEGEYARPGPAKFSIDLALRGHEENPKVKALHDAIKALDDYVFKMAEDNCKLWFGKQRSHDALLEAFVPSIKVGRPSKDGSMYPPNLKISLKKKLDTEESNHGAENFDCPVYDQTSRTDPSAKPLEGINIEELLSRGTEVTTLLQASMIWIVSDRFGISWKAKQIRIDTPGSGAGTTSGYGFVDEDDEDVPVQSSGRGITGGGTAFREPAEFSAAPAAPAARSVAAAPAKPVFEEDDDEVPAPAPPAAQVQDEDEIPAPAAPKKTVMTKKTVQTKLVAKAK